MNENVARLRSSDDEIYEVDPRALSGVSPFLEGLLADCNDRSEAIPLKCVAGRELRRVVEFCNRRHYHHQADVILTSGGVGTSSSSSEQQCAPDGAGHTAEALTLRKEQEAWERSFMALDTDELYDLMMAANFLHIEPLLNLCFAAVREAVKGKTPEEIRRHFGIPNDLGAEEQEAIRRQNQTLFR